MGSFFAREILDAAVQIERNGKAFYDLLAEREARREIREIFEFLAGEEAKHIEQIRSLEKGLADPPDTSWEREDFELYLHGLIKDHVFGEDGSGTAGAGKVATSLDALDLGIRFEKDTLIFLNELFAIVRAEEHPVLDRLVDFEKEHLSRLIDLKRKLLESEDR